MEFELKQEKLVGMFEKLMIRDIFPSSIISMKEEGKIFSIQKDRHARALRFITFKESYFDKVIKGPEESVEINIEKALKLIKSIPSTEKLNVKTEGNKFVITGQKKTINLNATEPEEEIQKGLPFKMQGSIPTIGEGVDKVLLDVDFKIDLSDFKEIIADATPLKTEFYKLSFNKDKIQVRVGDLHDTSENTVCRPAGKINNGKELDVTLTYGIPQIGDTFRNDIRVNTNSNSPAWIYEKTADYTFGVLLPPFTQED